MIYKSLPVDKQRTPMQKFPAAVLAQQRYTDEDASVSSVITLTDNTTNLEVSAVGGAAVIKWIPTTDTQASVVSAASGANYDHVIPSDTTRPFAVPVERMGVASNVGENIKNGLYRRVAIKSVGVASVLLSEY